MKITHKVISTIQNRPLVKDSFWALFGNGVGKGLSLLVGIVIANLLGSNDYGQFGMIKSTLIYLTIFSTFGLGVTGTKFVAQYLSENQGEVRIITSVILKITFTFGCFIALILALTAKQIAYFMEAPELSRLLRISSVAVLFNAVNSSQIGILAGYKAFKQISTNNILAGVFTCLSGLVLTYLFRLEGAIISISLSYLFNCIINKISLNRIEKNYPCVHSNFYSQTAKSLIAFSFPIALQEGLQSISQWATIAVLVKLSDYSELGIYSATSQWTAIISFIPAVLKNVTLSHLSSNSGVHNKTVYKMLLVNGVSSFIIFLFIFIFSGIISSWYGDSFVGFSPVLNLMVLSCLFGSMGSVFIQELISIARNWTAFFVSFIKSVLVIVFGVLLIMVFHFRGSSSFAISSVFANIIYFVSLALLYNTSRKHYLH